MTVQFPFDNSYARLAGPFSTRQVLAPVAQPRLVRLNEALAGELGLDAAALRSEEGVAIMAGNRVAEGSEPVALAYAGHQFGHFVPSLGDGRAVLLGEVVDRHGARRDIALKGSGRTAFSRGGDGRAALGPVLREYLVSEAMAAMGIPTTRALAAVATGEAVVRETALPGAVLVRVAASHIRVGTFEYLAARGDAEGLRVLADHVIARHHPGAAGAAHPYRALLEGVVVRQAELVARWLLVGFVHGVMNTDNTSVSGETIDYGPCAFLDAYDPAAVFSSIDQNARYAYASQPHAMLWNLSRLAEAMMPLLGEDEAEGREAAHAALSRFGAVFNAAYLGGLRAKLGLVREEEGDAALAEDLLTLMARGGADFTVTFRRLCDVAGGAEAGVARAMFADGEGFDAWAARWAERGAREGVAAAERAAAMRAVSPAVIPRNALVEAALEAAVGRGDMGPFEAMLASVLRPWEDRPGDVHQAAAGRPEVPYRTFCGT
ncbi:MAG: protein adenylyltransferase SelO [Janthinobacterium lividum]